MNLRFKTPTAAQLRRLRVHETPPVREKWTRYVREPAPVIDSELAHEDLIVFTHVGLSLKPRYVRWGFCFTNTLAGVPNFKYPQAPGFRLIGFSTSKKGHSDEPRRVFYLTGNDPYDFVGAPAEAVDPLSIWPGARGYRTAQSLRPEVPR